MHCWGSKDELLSNVLQRTPADDHTSVGEPTKTYIYKLSKDTGCCPMDLPRVMVDKNGG